MAKGSNNIRSKKPHSSKPYDVSNSFVKKVTSGVSSLLPQSSWFSRWFTSNSNAEEEKNPPLNEGEKPEDDLATQSPPCKRARIPLNRPFPANSFRVSSPIDRGETHPWPSESITSPIPNVFSDSPVPGPSGLGRTPVAAFQSPIPNTESLEGKINGDGGSDSSESTSGCSSLAPQRNTSSGSMPALRTPTAHKLSNHMLQFSLFPSGTHKLSPTVSTSITKRRPSFNVSSFASPNMDSSKTSRESSLNSPFYIGRTMYGGASAYRRPRDGIPSESLMSSSRRGGVSVRPANEKIQLGSSAEAGMSQTARRILEALEQFSSPVSEARRMPLPSQPPLSAKRKRPPDSTSPLKSSNPPAAATNPLTIPVPPERLRLHRLQDATEAARRLASSRIDTRGNYTLRTSDETTLHSVTGKVTKSKPLNENERAIPVNLPNIPLPITSLPSFDFSSLTQSTSNNSSPRTKTLITATKKSAVSEQMGASAGVENNQIPCATSSSTVSSLSIASGVESTVTTTISGMKPFNVIHDNSSDVFKTKCDRKSESTSINLGNLTQPNLKTVSFTEPFSFNFNKSIDTNSKIDQSNVSSFKTNIKANEFVFSTPTVLPTTKSKETSESKMNNFYFCKPEVLELRQCDKISRKEPNGFHKRSLKSGDSNDSSVKQISINEKSRKNIASSESELEVKKSNQSGKSSRVENNGWNTKFVLPDSWECPECMVQNKNDLEACVCCRGKRPNASSTIVRKDTTGQASDVSSVPKSSWGSKFQLQPGMWECSACLVRNMESDVRCISCSTSRNSVNIPAQPEVGNWGQFKMKSDMWECSTCLVRNKEQDTKCVSCSNLRPGKTGENNSANKTNKTSDDWGQKFKKGSGTWECPVCMIRNEDSLIKCAACQEPKPGLNKNSVSTTGSIKFNFEIPSAASSFKFGIDKADSKIAESSTPAPFQFGCEKPETAKSQIGFSFGTSEPKVTTGFTFGIPQPSSTSSSIAASTVKPSKLDASIIPGVATGVPSTSTTSASVSSKTCVLPETTKVSGFSFGSKAALKSEGSAESKKPSTEKVATHGSETPGKDLQFATPKASGITSPGSNDDKKAVATPITKPGQSGSTENKNISFGTPSVSSKPAAFSFSTSVTSAPATTTATDTTSFSALVAPVTSSIPGGTTTSVTRTSSIFSFGSNSSSSFSKPPTSSSPQFSFKGSGTQSTPNTLFGATSPNQFKAPNEGLFSNKTAASTVAPVFGNSTPKSTSVPTFEAAPTTSTSAPTFNAPSVAVFTPGSTCTGATFGSSTSKPIFASSPSSFGLVTTSANSSASTSVVSSTSGTGSNIVTTNANFGVPTSTVSLTMTSPSFPTTTSTNFAMPVSTGIVTSSSSTPAFGTSAFGPATTISNTFGITSSAPTYTTTASNIFGATNTSSFGASANPGFGSTAATQNFGSSFAGVTTTSPAFGTTTPAVSTVASTPTLSVFGGFSSSSKPTQGLFLFGSTPTSTTLGSNFSFNNSGQAGVTQPTASGAPAFNFGSANVTNVTTSATTTPAGVATASATGAVATPAQGFGGFSFTPGGTATSSNPGLFGNTNPSVPVFGSNAASTPSAPTFGAGNAAGSNVFRPAAFSFGSSGSQQPFPFGGNTQPGTNQASGNTGFSFGQSQSHPTAQPLPQFNPNVRPTFNFTGGETPQFTAAAPSTPTVQRRVKKAVRRSQRP